MTTVRQSEMADVRFWVESGHSYLVLDRPVILFDYPTWNQSSDGLAAGQKVAGCVHNLAAVACDLCSLHLLISGLVVEHHPVLENHGGPNLYAK